MTSLHTRNIYIRGSWHHKWHRATSTKLSSQDVSFPNYLAPKGSEHLGIPLPWDVWREGHRKSNLAATRPKRALCFHMVFGFFIVHDGMRPHIQDPTVLAVPRYEIEWRGDCVGVRWRGQVCVQACKRKEGKAWLWAGQIVVVVKDQVMRIRGFSSCISASNCAQYE